MHALRALPHSRARTQSFEKGTDKRRYRAEKEPAWLHNIGDNNVVPLAQLYPVPLRCRAVCVSLSVKVEEWYYTQYVLFITIDHGDSSTVV